MRVMLNRCTAVGSRQYPNALCRATLLSSAAKMLDLFCSDAPSKTTASLLLHHSHGDANFCRFAPHVSPAVECLPEPWI